MKLFAVAIFTLIKTGVVNHNLTPAIAAVAVGAPAGIVSGGSLVKVTGRASVVGGVLKGNQLPIFGRVAG